VVDQLFHLIRVQCEPFFRSIPTMISETERKRLIAILGKLGSEHAGERDAAATQAEAFRRKLNLTWAELLAKSEAPPERPIQEPPRPQPAPQWKPPPRPERIRQTQRQPTPNLSLLEGLVIPINSGRWLTWLGFLYFAAAVIICEVFGDAQTLPAFIVVLCILPLSVIVLIRFALMVKATGRWAYALLFGGVLGGVMIAFRL
jgi:hypothetical protein